MAADTKFIPEANPLYTNVHGTCNLKPHQKQQTLIQDSQHGFCFEERNNRKHSINQDIRGTCNKSNKIIMGHLNVI